jgi:hypothetical protein
MGPPGMGIQGPGGPQGVKGPTGEKGDDGVGIHDIYYRDDQLEIILTNGKQIKLNMKRI